MEIRRICTCIIIFSVFLLPVKGYTATTDLFRGGVYTQEQILTARLRLQTEPYAQAYKDILRFADRELTSVPAPHEIFISARNEEGQQQSMALRTDAYNSYMLALVYRLNDNPKYADKALEYLMAWVNTCKEIWSREENTTGPLTDAPLSMAATGICLLYAGDLLMNYPPFYELRNGEDASDKDLFLKWVEQVYKPSVDSIIPRINNWSNWGVLAGIEACALLGKKDEVFTTYTLHLKNNIASQIDPNGNMPYEALREEKSMTYHYYALLPMTRAAYTIRNMGGENLFGYIASNGGSMKKALDYLYMYVNEPFNWPAYQPITEPPVVKKWPADLFESVGPIYNDSRFINWVHETNVFYTYDKQQQIYVEAGRAVNQSPLINFGAGGGGWLFATLMAPEKETGSIHMQPQALSSGHIQQIGQFTVPASAESGTTYQIDVTQAIMKSLQIPENNAFSVWLHVLNQSASSGALRFSSQTFPVAYQEKRAQLLTQTGNGTITTAYATVCATVRGGAYANMPTDRNDLIEVKQGDSHSDTARYAYIKFDISELKDLQSITQVTLMLSTQNVTGVSFDISVRHIADSTWNPQFLTMNNRPVIGESVSLGQATGGSFSSNIKLTNTFLEEKNFWVVYALYSGQPDMRVLQSISLRPYTLVALSSAEVYYNMPLPEVAANMPQIAKIYVLNDFSSMLPLDKPGIYNSNTTSQQI